MKIYLKVERILKLKFESMNDFEHQQIANDSLTKRLAVNENFDLKSFTY
jgi:predicted KAP-like P-loop ATPase